MDKGNDESSDLYQKIIREMKAVVGNVEYIQEQRLVTTTERRFYEERMSRRTLNSKEELIQTVEEIPTNIKQIIRQASLEYSMVASTLDSSFPIRLFNEKIGIDEKEFDEKMEDMRHKVEKLDEYGISGIQKMEKIEFKEDDARALKVYFEDFERKYNQYKALIEKLDMYKKMVNERFRFKNMQISSEYGIKILDKNNNIIKLRSLSSGEKETLVLFFRLLFKVNDSCCLETMLLSNSAIKEGLYDTYHGGSDKMDELFDNVIIQLGTISMLRRKQAKENLSINFNKMKLLDCYDDISGILDSKKLFENLGLKDDIYNECKERALHLSITELYENTNGHDLCRILGKIFKAKKGDIGEERVRNAMICSYRKSDFEETDLYSKLLMYRQNYNVKYVEE